MGQDTVIFYLTGYRFTIDKINLTKFRSDENEYVRTTLLIPMLPPTVQSHIVLSIFLYIKGKRPSLVFI